MKCKQCLQRQCQLDLITIRRLRHIYLMPFRIRIQDHIFKLHILDCYFCLVYTVWTVKDILFDPYPFIVLVNPHPFKAIKGYGSTKTSLTVHAVYCQILNNAFSSGRIACDLCITQGKANDINRIRKLNVKHYVHFGSQKKMRYMIFN